MANDLEVQRVATLRKMAATAMGKEDAHEEYGGYHKEKPGPGHDGDGCKEQAGLRGPQLQCGGQAGS